MLTRRDILNELKRMGVRKPSLLKSYLRDFERYIGIHYDFRISKAKKRLDHRTNQDPASPSSSSEKINLLP
jgi:hypothetical protein